MTNPAEPGVLTSARGAASTLLEIIRTRLQLLGVDLQDQGQRVIQALLLALLAAISLMVGVVCAGVLFTLWLWQVYPALAIAFVLLVPITGTVLCGALCVRTLRAPPGPFAATLSELDKDLAALRRNP